MFFSKQKQFQTLSDTKTVDELLQSSEPVIIFKHSTACGTSAWAYDQMQKAVKDEVLPEDKVYMVVVQDARDVSDYIAEKTGVTHESPQVIVVKSGEVVYAESHRAIDTEQIKNNITI